MRIWDLSGGCHEYTSNVYLLTGTRNRITNVNTLIDTGRDPAIIRNLSMIPVGIGKRPVEQVILTHTHYDHTGNLVIIKESYRPRVCGFSSYYKGIDHVLHDNEVVLAGDSHLWVIHAPGHSGDSVCLYCPEEQTLFVGDTPVLIRSRGGCYEMEFIRALERIASLDVKTIFFGHGPPLQERCNECIRESLFLVQESLNPE